MFKPPLCRYSTRSLMAWDITPRKTSTRKNKLSFLGPKIVVYNRVICGTFIRSQAKPKLSLP